MSASASRQGIERKILTTILWVGVLPMAVALIFGYVTARSGQSKSVQQTLLTSVGKTAEGLHLLVNYRLNSVQNMAESAEVIEAMRLSSAGAGGDRRCAKSR